MAVGEPAVNLPECILNNKNNIQYIQWINLDSSGPHRKKVAWWFRVFKPMFTPTWLNWSNFTTSKQNTRNETCKTNAKKQHISYVVVMISIFFWAVELLSLINRSRRWQLKYFWNVHPENWGVSWVPLWQPRIFFKMGWFKNHQLETWNELGNHV